MNKERDGKQLELDALLRMTVKDLWRKDLNEFLEEWDRFEVEINEAEDAALLQMRDRMGGKGSKLKKGKGKKKNDSSDNSDSDSDDFLPLKSN